MHPPTPPKVSKGGVHRSQHPLRVVMFSAMPYEVTSFQNEINQSSIINSSLDLTFVQAPLDHSTVALAKNAHAISLFVSDSADISLLETLSKLGIQLIVLRYAGASSVDVEQAAEFGIRVARAPAHSPTSIAEYTIALMMSLARKVHIASNLVRDGSLSRHGLVGFELADKTVGIIGTGKVGQIVARILQGFRCKILAYDLIQSSQVINSGGTYVSLKRLLKLSDIITLHAPLVPGTYHLIGRKTLPRCKNGVHIINTSRGALIDVAAILEALQTGQVAGLAMDAYEGERFIFFQDHEESVHDWNFEILKSLPNVLLTGRQAALTTNALAAIAKSTLHTLIQYHNHENIDYAIAVNESRFTRPKSSRPTRSVAKTPKSNTSDNVPSTSRPATLSGSVSPVIDASSPESSEDSAESSTRIVAASNPSTVPSPSNASPVSNTLTFSNPPTSTVDDSESLIPKNKSAAPRSPIIAATASANASVNSNSMAETARNF